MVHENLESAVKSLKDAHDRYLSSSTCVNIVVENSWCQERCDRVDNLLSKISCILTNEDVRSVTVQESENGAISSRSARVELERMGINDSARPQTKRVVQTEQDLCVSEKIETQSGKKQYVKDWIEKCKTLNPEAKAFEPEPAIDSWIDQLVIGEQTTEIPTNAGDGGLAQAIIRLESERDLPKVDLPMFNGDAIGWPRFVEQFHCQVHTRPGISDVRRMDLLQSHVEGEAKRLVHGLGYSGRNYALALKELKQAFGHKVKVARAFLQGVTAGPPITSHDPSALRKFYVAVRDCITTIKQLQYNSDLYSSDILLRVARRLPRDKVSRWNEYVRNIRGEPNLLHLVEWLKARVDAEFNPFAIALTNEPKTHKYTGAERSRHYQESHNVRNQVAEPSVNIPTHEPKFPCPLCSEPHYLYKCTIFANKSVSDRRKLIAEKKLCFNCLKPSHHAEKCFSTIRCRENKCGQKHHTLLHQPREDHVKSVSNMSKNSQNCVTPKAKIYFQIVPVHVFGYNGRIVKTHALLDSASDVTLIHEELAENLGLRGEPRKLKVKTFNGVSTENSSKVSFDIKSAGELECERIHISEAWTVDSQAFHCLPQNIDPEWEHVKPIDVKDINPSDVKMLIGLDVPKAHIQMDVVQGEINQPIAVKTPLGWSLMGVAAVSSTRNHDTQARIRFTIAEEQNMNTQIEQFWKTESFGVNHYQNKPFSVEDQKAKTILETSTELVNGHYKINMLWKSNCSSLPNNRESAYNRYRLLAKRLVRDTDFEILYSQTLNDYVKKNLAVKLTPEEIEESSPRTWYLPHHGVVNEHKPGKVRVVFDAAAMHERTSLNSNLMTGPDLVNSLLGILQRFRLYDVALSADIEGMYHQVMVPEIDSQSLRFLWKENLKVPGPPDVYRMKVHIFGAADSSSCANYALKRTAIDNEDKFDKQVIDTTLRDFYVDDLLKSVETEQIAKSLSHDLTEHLKFGGFRLHKWISNSKHVLNTIPEGERAVNTKNLDLDNMPTQRALGLKWNVGTDCLVFDPQPKTVPLTKRGVISTVCSIFDPCGYITPFTVRAKCIIQELWRQNIGWDDELPSCFRDKWNSWLKELSDLQHFQLPRHHVDVSSHTVENQIHIFSDASERCFGACAYLRYLPDCDSGEVKCSFLASKTRVAPIKP